MTGPLRAVLYARVSTSQQAQRGLSLPDQLATLRRYCRQEKLLVVEEIRDDFTGSVMARPGTDRIRALALESAFDVLLVCVVDRLARDHALGAAFVEELADRGIETRFVQQSFGTGAEGELGRDVVWAVAKYEARRIAARTSAGRHRKAAGGRLPTRVEPYGYRQVRAAQAAALPEYAGRSGELLLAEPEANVVRELFARFVAGASLHSLVEWLSSAGIPTRAGGAWYASTVRQMLQNPAYAGEAVWGREACRQVRDLTAGGNPRVLRTPRPESEWHRIPVPAVVDQATWDLAQQRLSLHEPRGRPSEVWLLRGAVRCAVCRREDGSPLACSGFRGGRSRARPAYEVRYYRCNSGHVAGREFCGARCRADLLEADARELAQALTVTETLEEELSARYAARQGQDRELASARRELEQVNARLTRLVEEALDLLLPRDLVREKAAELNRQREGLTCRVAALERATAAPVDHAIRARTRAEEIRALLAGGLTPAGWQQLFRSYFVVLIHPDRRPPEWRVLL